MALRSADPNTLKGYDLVITVSQDALNKQFKTLYDKEIPSDLMPDPEDLQGFAQLPPAKHYINHDIKIHPQTLEDWDDEDFEDVRPAERPADGKFWLGASEWVEGEIEAPFVSFGEEEGDKRAVRVHLKFKTGRLYYQQNSVTRKVNLAGCTLSWLVKLTHTEVNNAMSDIVAASADPSKHALVAPAVADKIKAIADEKYTVTALFCLFQSTRVVNSFQFLNLQGVNEAGSSKAAIAASLMSSYFTTLAARTSVASTPNNPFVLGYGLTQKVEGQSDEQKKRAEHVPYLVPRDFDLTVTKGDADFSNGVLNYCIVTNRSDGTAPIVVDSKKDIAAGIWDDGDTPYARIRADGKASGADGVMAFSRGIFRDLWLKENFLPYFKANLEELKKSLVPQGDNVAKEPNYWCQEATTIGQGQPNEISMRQDFRFNDMPCQEMDTQKMLETESLSNFMKIVLKVCKTVGIEMKYDQRRLTSGLAEAQLVYTSDVQNNPNLSRASDQRRKIYFDLQLKSLVTITQQAAGICNINRIAENKERNLLFLNPITAVVELTTNMDFYKRIFSEWRDARRADIAISVKAGFDLGPAEDSWKLETIKTAPRTTIPLGHETMKRQILGPTSYSTLENIGSVEKLRNLSERMNEDGVIIELSNHAMFKEFGTSKGMDNFAQPATQWAEGFENTLESNMAALASSLATKLILPAGNVFEFKSLNTDSQGHVYTLITYKEAAGVEQHNTSE
ncbi:hypothetical protein BD289DRAFT_40162 [Coniella lustricola]|uniref:Uncharacterized protein n=1 Tax=Coniella lustricola TaxID=2025994 RepID=A0A2T3A254_9PEZI|nr:hypothetical protein BD289DRAFT_40162 [Coniella lustricola]